MSWPQWPKSSATRFHQSETTRASRYEITWHTIYTEAKGAICPEIFLVNYFIWLTKGFGCDSNRPYQGYATKCKNPDSGRHKPCSEIVEEIAKVMAEIAMYPVKLHIVYCINDFSMSLRLLVRLRLI